MGAGKSTVGSLLASTLNIPFIDMDDYIEDRCGKSISTIFTDSGEEYFRKIEKDCLNEIIKSHEKLVLATGGGVPCFHNNMKRMNKNGITVYISASYAKLFSRISKESHRPLVAAKSPHELMKYIKKHMQARRKYYLQAAVVVRSSGTAEEIASRIIRRLP